MPRRLSQAGMSCTPYIMQSNCGVDTVRNARQVPITMIESGPASGVWGAAALDRVTDRQNAIAIDIGERLGEMRASESGQAQHQLHGGANGALGGSGHGARGGPR